MHVLQHVREPEVTQGPAEEPGPSLSPVSRMAGQKLSLDSWRNRPFSDNGCD